MQEYKGRITTKLFWTFCGICAAWFVFNLSGRLTHSFFVSLIAALIILVWFTYKVYYIDNISIILTEDKQLLVKRFSKIVKSFVVDKYYWSEYSKYTNTKNSDDHDIFYVSKETGDEGYIDATNFSGVDYEEILEKLGAKNINENPVKIATIKK